MDSHCMDPSPSAGSDRRIRIASLYNSSIDPGSPACRSTL
jgi:hypothetical protein